MMIVPHIVFGKRSDVVKYTLALSIVFALIYGVGCLSLIISVLLLIGFKFVLSFRKNLNIFYNGTEHIDDFNYTCFKESLLEIMEEINYEL